MEFRNCRIIGSGKYLPKRLVSSNEIDKKIGAPSGWSEEKSGVRVRHFIENETASFMATQAINDALRDANLDGAEIGCIIGTSGTMEQPIPCNAALIQQEMGLGKSGVTCFDVNSTCLSFLVGLDLASYLIEAERYQNILLVASDISSVGLNWGQNESCVLFGDGAAAVIIGKARYNESGKVIASRIETYSEGARFSEIRGGGSRCHAREYSNNTKEDFLFDMNGKAIFKLASELMEGFVSRLFEPGKFSIADMDMIIPHQASRMAMTLIRKRLGIREEKFMSIIEDHGNVIAASLPMALHEAIKQQRVARGDKIMLLGTSAGLSFGGIVLEY